MLAYRSCIALVRIGGLITVLATSACVCASTAYADASATVKARTQKMAAPNLTSQQNGWYDAGTRLSLICSSRGQSVKGFFSFNIPNGGWDNLWYKTSDGNFVADVDIETGTLDVIASDCSSGPAPGPATSPDSGDRVARALSWARNEMATNPNNPIQCFEFVEAAYGGVKWPGYTALDFFNTLNGQGKIHTDTNPPAGALVFSSDRRFDGGMGHVMLSEGNGQYITANYYQTPKIRRVPLTYPGNTYLGWAIAPY